MATRTPVSDYVETSGIVFFARMVDKIRLRSRGELPEGYHIGFEDTTSFDARFCLFWEIDYDALHARVLEGGTDEELLAWCFRDRNFPNEVQILAWNSFLLKRGWRDSGSASLSTDKTAHGWADRDDIQTYVDFHDVDEGRKPKFA